MSTLFLISSLAPRLVAVWPSAVRVELQMKRALSSVDSAGRWLRAYIVQNAPGPEN